MPPQVLDLAQAWRADLVRGEAAALRAMTQDWLAVEAALRADITATAEQAAREGWTAGRLARQRRYLRLMTQVDDELRRYGAGVGTAVTARQQAAVQAAVQHSGQALRAAAGDAQITLNFDRLPVPAVERMAALTAQGPVRALLDDAAGSGADAMGRELTTGVALGRHPTVIARRMLRYGLGTTFTRLATVARTEVLRAYRTATLDAYRAAGVVAGYRRLAAHDARSCLGCLFADGRTYDLGEAFAAHPACRCTLVPVLRYGPPPQWETGQAWFARQSESVQREMLGPTRFDLWRSGRATLDDMVQRRDHATWGGALVPTPVRALGRGARAIGPASLRPPARPAASPPVTAAPPPVLTPRGMMDAAAAPVAPLDVALRAAERSIYRLRSHEEAYAFDVAGKTLLYKRGGADYVEFTDDELRRFAGAVLTHNHPLTTAGSAFSPEDVRLALNYQMREMRAVGGRYVYTLRADPTLTWADVQPIYDRANYDVRVDFTRRIQTGALRIEDAELNHHHEVWTRVQGRVGADRFQYARREHGYGDD